MMAPLAATVARLVSCSTLLWHPVSLEPPTHSPFAGVSSRGLSVSAPFMRHMLAFPLTLASSSGACSQPQSIASRSSTQAPRFFLRGTPTFGSPSSIASSRSSSTIDKTPSRNSRNIVTLFPRLFVKASTTIRSCGTHLHLALSACMLLLITRSHIPFVWKSRA